MKRIDFYSDFEGEPGFIIQSLSDPEIVLLIWEGYIDDLFSNPKFYPTGWTGLTRDYHECLGAWDDTQCQVIWNIPEYLNDLLTYQDKQFRFDKTRDVFDALCTLLKFEDSASGIEIKAI